MTKAETLLDLSPKEVAELPELMYQQRLALLFSSEGAAAYLSKRCWQGWVEMQSGRDLRRHRTPAHLKRTANQR